MDYVVQDVLDQKGEHLAAQIRSIIEGTPGSVTFKVSDKEQCGRGVGAVLEEERGHASSAPGSQPFRAHRSTDVAAENEQM